MFDKKQWKEKNKEHCRQYNKQYYLKNKKQYYQYYIKHKNQHKQTCKLYYIRNREKILAYAKQYRDKKLNPFPWLKSYYNAKSHCIYLSEPYYKRGIRFNMTKEDFKYLWFRDKAYLLNKPSIDRINSQGNYELNNCQFIELKDNLIKDRRKSYA